MWADGGQLAAGVPKKPLPGGSPWKKQSLLLRALPFASGVCRVKRHLE